MRGRITDVEFIKQTNQLREANALLESGYILLAVGMVIKDGLGPDNHCETVYTLGRVVPVVA